MLPKLSEEGAPIDFAGDNTIAPGVEGYAIEAKDGVIWIPSIAAKNPGNGDVGRFLDALDKDRTFLISNVLNAQLVGMLKRRGFKPEYIEGILCFRRTKSEPRKEG